MSLFSGYFGNAKAKIDDSQAQQTLLNLKNGVREINNDTDQAHENLLLLKRVGQQILSGLIRTFEGTKFAQIAQTTQNVLITGTSVKTIEVQAAAAMAAGNIPAYIALQGLALQQIQNLAQAEVLKYQAEYQTQYLDRLTALRDMYS